MICMTLLLFILILSILIFVHEFGHFLAAKKAGILVEEFGFGFPPRIWGKKIGETLYSINALPIGGFVKLYGEDGDNSGGAASSRQRADSASRGRAYFEKSILRRLTVLLAGVFMNLVLGIVCFSVLYFVLGIPVKTNKVIIVGIAESSPAQLSELKEDDEIISVNETKITSLDQFIKLTSENSGKKTTLEINRPKDNPCQLKEDKKILGGSSANEMGFSCRNGNLLVFLIPRQNPPAGEGPLGVAISDVELKKFPWWQMPYLGATEGFKESLNWGKTIINTLGKTIRSLVIDRKIPQDVAGPVGIFQVTGTVAKSGILAVLQFLGILSVNLAIMNILPLPALDGGRLLFLGYEVAFRKKVKPEIEAAVNNVGMIFLLSLMVLITINDLLRIFRK